MGIINMNYLLLKRLIFVVSIAFISFSVCDAQSKRKTNKKTKSAMVTYGDGTQRNLPDRFDADGVELEVYSQDYKENPMWTDISKDDSAFYLMSLLEDSMEFYVEVGMVYKPISVGSFCLGQYYGVPSRSEIVLCKKTIVSDKEVFTPVITLKFPEKSKDSIFVIGKNADGSLGYRAYDISLNSMPINSLSIINFSASKLGIVADEQKMTVSPMQSSTLVLPKKPDVNGVFALNQLAYGAYDLTHQENPPQCGTMRFHQNMRCILIFFEFSDNSMRAPIRIVNPGPRR